MSEHTTVGDSSQPGAIPDPHALAHRGLSLATTRLEPFGGLQQLTRSPLALVARRATTLASLIPQFELRRVTAAELDALSHDGHGPGANGDREAARSNHDGTPDLLTCWLALDAAALLLAALADLDGVRELESLRDELEPALLSGEP